MINRLGKLFEVNFRKDQPKGGPFKGFTRYLLKIMVTYGTGNLSMIKRLRKLFEVYSRKGQPKVLSKIYLK